MTNPDMKWRDAIITVLQDADGAMHYTEVAEEIAKRKLRKNLGATPAATVASMVSTSSRSGEDSPFLRTEPGRVMSNPRWTGALATDTPEITPTPEPEDIPRRQSGRDVLEYRSRGLEVESTALGATATGQQAGRFWRPVRGLYPV